MRLGNWLTSDQSQRLWHAPNVERLKGKRDRARLAVLLACGVRRHEAIDLDFDHIQQREEHWAIVGLKGKAGHTRTIPIPEWVKALLDDWARAANLTTGKLFRRVHKSGKAWGEGLTEKAVWNVVREHAREAGIEKLAPHDLGGRVPGWVTPQAVNRTRYSFFLSTSRSRRPSDTSAAIAVFGRLSMNALASSRRADSIRAHVRMADDSLGMH